MRIRVCATIVEPRWVVVPSRTHDDKTYIVVPSTIWNDAICDCPGFFYHGGKCSHIDGIEMLRCQYWSDRENERIDDDLHCPYCGSDTVLFEMEPEYA